MSRVPRPLCYLTEGSRLGILLIHGFTGTTNELAPLARHLHSRGYSVLAPLLKGHGETPEQMACTTWVDWFVSAREGYRRLRQAGCTSIVAIGFSMGGLLAIKLAQHEEVAGLVTLSTPVKVRDPRFSLAKYFQSLIPYTKRRMRKAEHIEQHLFIYDRIPVPCVASLGELMENVSYVLHHIKQPALIIQSGRDETVHPSSGRRLYEALGSHEKELFIFEESSHIITLDHEQERLHQVLTRFVQRVARQEENL